MWTSKAWEWDWQGKCSLGCLSAPPGIGLVMKRFKQPPKGVGLYYQIEVELASTFENMVKAFTLQWLAHFTYGETLGFTVNRLLQDYFVYTLHGNLHRHKPIWVREKENLMWEITFGLPSFWNFWFTGGAKVGEWRHDD